jgi:hypothetical protein
MARWPSIGNAVDQEGEVFKSYVTRTRDKDELCGSRKNRSSVTGRWRPITTGGFPNTKLR